MITNLLATIIISVVTNVIGVTEYWTPSYTYPPSQGYWSESDHWPNNIILDVQSRTRTSPDKHYIEIRRIRTLMFEVEGKKNAIELENTLLKKIERNRKVETKETWEEKEVTPQYITATNTVLIVPNSVIVSMYHGTCATNNAISKRNK